VTTHEGTGLWGPVTAVPGPGLDREATHRFLVHALDLSPRRAAWLGEVMAAAGIERRYSCVNEFLEPPRAETAGPDHWEGVLGGLAGRMRRFRTAAADLSVQAASDALSRSGFCAQDVTHLVFVTCTGFENPGADVDLCDRLGLRNDVHRVQIGFMGCQASMQGMRVADAFCRSEPDAVALLVAVELGSLHFDPQRTDRESLIAACLFGDGAAASLISRRSAASVPDFRFLDFASLRIPDLADLLTWKVEDPAFRMGLARELPDALGAQVRRFVDALAPSAALGDLGWAVHPGGRAILDTVAAALNLPAMKLAPSRQVLADYGNLSSPTIQFVLSGLPPDWQEGLALAVGPGISLEGLRWRR
jgi:predicted naringenin-chalcone synthase